MISSGSGQQQSNHPISNSGSNNNKQPHSGEPQQQTPPARSGGKPVDSGVRLYIGGFPRRTTKTELEEFCSRYGKVKGDIDIIPNKQFAFVTFSTKEDATLAMFAIQQEPFKGSKLHVDWAKKRKDISSSSEKGAAGEEKTSDSVKGTGGVPPAAGKKEESGKHAVGGKDHGKAAPVPASSLPNRYIPGDMKETVVTPTHSQPHSAPPESKPRDDTDYTESQDVPPHQAYAYPPIPNLLTRSHYPESNPHLELTIRDTQNHDIKYTFRVKSLSSLKNYLLHEAAGAGVTGQDLFYTSSLKNNENKNIILYGGLPVVHIYQDLLGKEVLEPKENKEDRENFMNRKNKPSPLELPPPAKVPISQKKIPIEEVYALLASKNYESVHINTSPNGPSAPLHPEWKPMSHTFAFRRGNQLVMFCGETIVESFQFLLQSTNQSYRDLLPILLKYGLCIFNSNKGAFITPAQLQ